MEHLQIPAKLNILLAEDNTLNQVLAVRILTKQGHEVTVVSDGSEAVDRLSKERFDLVLMDVQMPVMDGLEATRIIRNPSSPVLDHTIPIIAMTAHAFREDLDMCLEAGMNGYVPKPVAKNELMSVIRKTFQAD